MIILVLLFVSGYLILFFSPKPQLLANLSFSGAIYDDQQHLLRLTLNNEDKFRVFTPLKDIPKELIDATLLQEDRYFYSHLGVNPLALCKALWQTYIKKSRRMGASTISMQLARLKFAIHSKSIRGKIEQIARALQLEFYYSKDKLLEAYLNLAPYGGNIEGVGAASLVYFNSPVQKLTLPQSLTLAVIPQNPNKRTPSNLDLKKIRDHLYTLWLEKYPNDRNKKETFDLPLVMQNSHNLPFNAPHFVNMLIKDPDLKGQSIQSTLDNRVQDILNRITKSYLARKKGLGVYNASILLIDTRDMGIKALIGSADFFNQSISGQINGVDTKRSPGSTLKPFIYGLALDQGLIHPESVLKDVPHSFNGYNPENFDYDFMGPIKASDALILSRNIPALYLASQLNQPTLYQLLEKAQVSQLKAESYYGLSLNLGGVELTMKELVGLYAMLVNDGNWYPLRMHAKERKSNAVRLLSPEASFLVLDMLAKSTSKDFQNSSTLPVAWKTGTSSGYRDAWTLGTFGPYVMGVWIGNFDNKANPAFVGKEIAAPLFFELINGIKQEIGPLKPIKKSPAEMNLKKVKICKASGLLPTRYCSERDWTWFIPGVSPIKRDTIFREVAINNRTGLRTCHINEHTRFEIFEFWPSDILRIFKQAGIQRHTPPFYEEDCALTGNSGINPQITSPQAGISYVLRINSQWNNHIPLSAVSDAGIKSLYWFINESFVAKTKPGETFLWRAKPGKYVLRVVDDHGLADARNVQVEIK